MGNERDDEQYDENDEHDDEQYDENCYQTMSNAITTLRFLMDTKPLTDALSLRAQGLVEIRPLTEALSPRECL